MKSSFDLLAEDWEQLLARSTKVASDSQFHGFHRDKVVMITGAGGSVGSTLAMKIAQLEPRIILLLDASEQGLYQVEIAIARNATRSLQTVAILGSVADQNLLEDVFGVYRPDLVYHAAAHKHVPLLEANPVAAIANNAIGTHRLAQASAMYGVANLLMISTDKAADPVSILGASKRIAELVLQAASRPQTKMTCVRLGNILGTQGSVVPRFLDQISHGGPVTVTNAEMERFFFTLDESISLAFETARFASGGEICVPEVNRPVRVLELARYLIQKYGSRTMPTIPIVFTGLRPGEKMREQFVASDESLADSINGRLRRLRSGSLEPSSLAAVMAELHRATSARDLTGVLQAVQHIVPGYTPSRFVTNVDATSTAHPHA